MAHIARLWLLTLLLALTGCATLPTQIERPQLDLADIELREFGMFQQRFLVTLRAQNPNSVALPIRGLTYALELDGREFATGATAAAFELPAYGEGEIQLELTTSLARSGQWLIQRLQQGDTAFDYRIRGDVDIARFGIGRMPFEDTGSVDLDFLGAGR